MNDPNQQPDFTFDFHRVVGIYMDLETPTVPKGYESSAPRWGASILMRKDNPQEMEVFQKFQNHLWAFANWRWPGITQEQYLQMSKPYKDGHGHDLGKYPEVYVNSWVISGYRSLKQGKPRCVEGYDYTVIIPNEKADERFPDGTIVSVSFEAYFPKNQTKKQICHCLNGIQYVNQGEAIGKGDFTAEGHFQNYDDSMKPGHGFAPPNQGFGPGSAPVPQGPPPGIQSGQQVNQGFAPPPHPQTQQNQAVPGWGG